MNKQQKKRQWKTWLRVFRTLQTAFKWLLLAILIYLLLNAIQDFITHYTGLTEIVNRQGNTITHLQQQLNFEHAQNLELRHTVDTLQSQVVDLQQQEPTVYINGVPLEEMPQPTVEEERVAEELELITVGSLVTVPVVIVTMFSMLKGVLAF